ncbi:MAG: hypothetical protein ACLGXA_24470 [Acidobacteriota bacterium]
MNSYMEFRHSLMRGAKVRLMEMGMKPTKQAARKLVDREMQRLRALEKLQGATAPQGVTDAL